MNMHKDMSLDFKTLLPKGRIMSIRAVLGHVNVVLLQLMLSGQITHA
jgi:hypothetical protein